MRTTRILKLLAAATALATAVVAVILFAVQARTDAVAQPSNGPVPTEAPTTTASPATIVRPSTNTSPTTADPPTTTAPGPASAMGTLRPGDKGPAVLALQQHLVSLGYWLGTPDSTYGNLTFQAVTAFQKVEGMDRDGIAGPGTTAALAEATRPDQARAGGDLIEVDRTRQVLLVVRGGKVVWVLNTSTGTDLAYDINGRTELADTPAGHWTVSWVYDGVDVGELGGLYRPRYFHPDGIAVHGYHDVPNYPASHGCVRVSNAAIDWIWADNLMPLGSAVWVY